MIGRSFTVCLMTIEETVLPMSCATLRSNVCSTLVLHLQSENFGELWARGRKATEVHLKSPSSDAKMEDKRSQSRAALANSVC